MKMSKRHSANLEKVEKNKLNLLAIKELLANMEKKGLVVRQKQQLVFDEKVFNRLPKEIQDKYGRDSGFGKLPDMILADGGITQIRATKQAIKDIEKEIGKTIYNVGWVLYMKKK